MKMSNIITIAIITISATLLTGCEDGLQKELTDCQLTNTKLQSDIETKQMAIAKSEITVQDSMNMISEVLIENELLKLEVLKLQKSVEPKPKPQSKKSTLTPEQRARLQKRLLELQELQRISAEKMKKEAEAKAKAEAKAEANKK